MVALVNGPSLFASLVEQIRKEAGLLNVIVIYVNVCNMEVGVFVRM